MDDTIPIWLTGQLCVVLYIIGITFPYLFTYVSVKVYKQRIRFAIQRFYKQRQCREAKERRRREEAERVFHLQQKTAYLQRSAHTTYQNDTSSSSSSSSEEEEDEVSKEEVEEEVVFIDESLKNDRKVLQQYASLVDFFDGQGSTTCASAATTIMIHAPKKMYRKHGSVLHL